MKNIGLRDTEVDRRSLRQRDALLIVQESYLFFQDIKMNAPSKLANTALFLATVAKDHGFFEIWYRIFKNEPEVIQVLQIVAAASGSDC